MDAHDTLPGLINRHRGDGSDGGLLVAAEGHLGRAVSIEGSTGMGGEHRRVTWDGR